jgi:hypothetical protein
MSQICMVAVVTLGSSRECVHGVADLIIAWLCVRCRGSKFKQCEHLHVLD